MSIEAFKTKIKKGLARPNRYRVTITFPMDSLSANTSSGTTISNVVASLGLGSVVQGDGIVSMLCESAELPGSALATNEDKLWGPFRKMPYVNVYNDLSLTFMCDKDMTARKLFDSWQNFIIDKTGLKVKYYNDYIATVTVELLPETAESTSLYKVVCNEAYPIEIIAQPLAYDNNDTYLKLEVRMAYRNWDYFY